jgi:hypothetical protein
MKEGLAMKLLIPMIALLVCACDRESKGSAAASSPAVPDAASIKQSTPTSKAPLVLPLPKDQKELDRLILAGYTPHGNHLHPPGVLECPLAKDKEAVM